MRSKFIRQSTAPTSMDDPKPPQPTPFPIRIVQDPPRSDPGDSETQTPPDPIATGKKPSDYFYPAWDKFLAIEPARAKKTSSILQKTVAEREAVAANNGEGLQVEENASTSWEQAAEECKRKVEAIVEECTRLNQKYRDAIFDLEANEYCLKSLAGYYPKVSCFAFGWLTCVGMRADGMEDLTNCVLTSVGCRQD